MSDITSIMRPLLHFPRWGRRSTLLPTTSTLRAECRPPSLCHAPDSAWQRFMFWLLAPAPQDASPPLNRLPGVRTEFLAALADVDSEEAEELRLRIQNARSLRDLWHTRAELFRQLGIAHNQYEAEQRLYLLNRHFPTRAPRSQFASL